MKKNWLLVVSIVAAGLIGGALSNYLLMGTTSVAQERKVISAEEGLLRQRRYKARWVWLVR